MARIVEAEFISLKKITEGSSVGCLPGKYQATSIMSSALFVFEKPR